MANVAHTILALVGLAFIGICAGAILGMVAGFAYVAITDTSSFEGYSGMLVFLTFGPIGSLIGGLALPSIYAARRL